jgi:hypothetical protein
VSTYLVIRGVTETLKSLLDSQMELNGITVSSAPPDLEPDTKEKRINLYLYKVLENAYLKNQEIPGEGHPAAYGHPPLSLALYYLLTAFPDIDAYNKDYDLTVHEILADAMRVFHDYPILTDSMEIPPGSGTKLLHTSLQNQFEKGKITLEPLDTEELTKIWMGFTKPYRLSAGYVVSVVQIESQKPRRIARPVKTRRLHTLQLRRPQINDLVIEPPLPPPPSPPEMPPATARIGDTLTIHGINFVGVSEQLIIGDGKFSITPTSDSVIVFVVPNDPELQPGAIAVSVHVKRATEVIKGGLHSRGKLEIGENVVTSNQVPLMLAPQITNTDPPSGDSTTILTLEGVRLYKEDFKSYVLVGDTAIEVREPPGSEWDSPTPTRVQVPLTALAGQSVGAYPIRIRVNGAESLEDDKTFELT